MTPAADLVSVEYDQHKAEVIRTVASKLSAAGISSSESDLECSYNEAWHALYLALAEGEDIENRVGYLVTVTHRRALNEYRALKVSRRADSEALEQVGVELDIDARLDAEIQLRHIREGFRASLSSREREAAILCHIYGYSRPEAAEAMGVRPKRMEKIMDRASGKISSVVEAVRSGEHCTGMSSTIRAFALGLLDPEGEKYQLAVDHLEHCPACRREVWTDRGLAAIGPPLPVAFALLAGGATAGGGLAGGLALEGLGKGGAAAGGPAQAGASAVPAVAVAGGAVATVAVVASALALTTGVIGGGDSGDAGESDSSPAVAAAGTDAGSQGAATQARAARAAAARKAAKRARARAARKRRAARRAAAAAAEEIAPVPEPVYVPPPPAPPSPAPEPEPADARPVEPKPKRPERPGAAVDDKPTTDAGEEFGLR